MSKRFTLSSVVFSGFMLLSVLACTSLQAQQHAASSAILLPWESKTTTGVMQELSDKRNRFSKHYRLNDGSYKMISSAGSLHYQTADGWQDIDNTIQFKKTQPHVSHPYFNEANSFKTQYPSQLLHNEIITSLKEGELNEGIQEVYATDANDRTVFHYTPNACQTVELSDAVIQYKNIYPNAIARYTQQNDGRKFDMILQSAQFLDALPNDANFLVIKEKLTLPETWRVKKNESGYDLYSGSTWLIHLQTPMAYDNAGTSHGNEAKRQHEGQLEVEQSGHDLFVFTKFPLDWLRESNRQYPVNLDPTLTFYPDSVLYATGRNIAATGTKYSGAMDISTSSTGVAWAKFNISTLPTGSSVTGGHYWGYHIGGSGAGSKIVSIRGFQYIDPMTAISSNIQNQTTLAGPLYDNNYVWGDNFLGWHGDTLFPNALNDITSQIAQGWTALGFDYNSGSGLNMVQDGYDATLMSNKPYLELDYTLSPCSGTPNPGNTLANSMANLVAVCPGMPVYFTVQNAASLGSGVSYQWYRSSTLTGPAVVMSGATNASFLYTIPGNTAVIYCVVTCLGSGSNASSVPVTVTVLPWNSPSCYCTSGATATQDEDIYNVTLNGNSTDPAYSFANGCTTVAPGPGSVLKQYSSFLTLPALANITQGTAATFSVVQDECDGAPYYSNLIGIWIDFNHNSSFSDPGEQVFIESSGSVGPRTVSGTFVVPATSIPGNTIMRVVCQEGNTPPSPCGMYSYGETEDYVVNVVPSSPCLLMTNPGNTIASVTSGCPGSQSQLSLQYPSYPNSAVSLQWFTSSGPITGATNTTYNATITATQSYHCVVACSLSGATYSSVPVTVQMNAATTGSSSYTACDSYSWNGNTYTNSGVYIATLPNAAGCDSIHTLNLTIHHSSSNNVALTACDSVQYNGVTYTSSFNVTQIYSNVGGCDSTVSVNINIHQSNGSSLTQTGCDYYLFNSTVYTTSGNYTHTMTNVNGCDSIIQLNLTINQSTDSTINAVSCNMYSINGQTYTNTGTYTQNYTNAVGCDSVVNLQIAIDTLNATITINGLSISTPNVGTYQWIDCNTNTAIPGATSLNFIPTASGSYAVVVSTATCVDTSVCLTMWLTGTNNVNLNGNSSIYPNPNQGVFDIEMIEDAAFTIMNDVGEIILQKMASKGKQTIDISAYAKGIYFLKIEEKNKTDMLKLLKE